MRILLADDQPRVRFALRVLLERQPGCQVVGDAATFSDVLDLVEDTHPHLILLGWELPGLTGDDSLVILRHLCPNLRVVVLSGRLEARQSALEAGADAFVSKSEPPDRLLAAIGGWYTGQSEP